MSMKPTQKNTISYVKQMLASNKVWALKALVRIYQENQTADEQVAEIEAKLLNEILAKADTTLIKLHFTGSLGIQASGALQKLYAVSRARSIRLKLKDEVGIAPTQEEIDKLCSDKQNQLIALVASKLVELTKTNPAEAAKASLALRELFSAV